MAIPLNVRRASLLRPAAFDRRKVKRSEEHVRLRPNADFFLIGPWVTMEFDRDGYLELG